MKLAIIYVIFILSSYGIAGLSNRPLERSQASAPKHVNLGAQVGLVTTDGDFGGSALLEATVLVDRETPLRVGLSSGIMFGSGTALPILVTGLYGFSGGKVQPYAGASIGPTIDLSGVGVFGSDVRLAILLRAGLRFLVLDDMDVVGDMMMGGLTGRFYIGPSLGVAIHF